MDLREAWPRARIWARIGPAGMARRGPRYAMLLLCRLGPRNFAMYVLLFKPTQIKNNNYGRGCRDLNTNPADTARRSAPRDATPGPRNPWNFEMLVVWGGEPRPGNNRARQHVPLPASTQEPAPQ